MVARAARIVKEKVKPFAAKVLSVSEPYKYKKKSTARAVLFFPGRRFDMPFFECPLSNMLNRQSTKFSTESKPVEG